MTERVRYEDYRGVTCIGPDGGCERRALPTTPYITLAACQDVCTPDPDCEGVTFLGDDFAGGECYPFYFLYPRTPCTQEDCVKAQRYDNPSTAARAMRFVQNDTTAEYNQPSQSIPL